MLAFFRKLILSHDTWKRCRPHIKDDILNKDQRFLVQQIDAYWQAHTGKSEATLVEFEAYFFGTRATHLKTAEITTYRSIFEQMGKCTDADAESILAHFIKQDYLGQIQQKVFMGSTDPDFELDEIGTLVSSYTKEMGKAVHTSDVFVTAATASPALRPPGFRFPLKELDVACGEVAQGDFIVVAARPEMGKTSFIAHTVGSWAQQKIHAERPIIWVNNEERSDKVFRRVVQSVLNETTANLLTAWPLAVAEFEKLVKEGRLLILKQNECNSTHQLDLLFEEFKPCAIIADQLDKVRIKGDFARDDLKLGALYAWGREKAAEYGPFIAVSQLDAEAEGQMYPDFSRMRGSKTDKQGEADLIICIGQDDRTKPTRCIHTPKNKLDGADELHRHAKWEVGFDPVRARYVSVMK